MKKLLFASLFLVACSSGPSFSVGDSVLVDWYSDSWHSATLVAECVDGGSGWTVDFKDDFYDVNEGSEPDCYPLYSITADAALSDGDVEVGDKLLAEWFDDSYLTVEVTGVTEGKYTVKFVSDGYEDEVALEQLRALPETMRPAEGEDVEEETESEEEPIK